MYDGIHYDPMALEENCTITKTVFPTSDPTFQTMALEVAETLKKVIYYDLFFFIDFVLYLYPFIIQNTSCLSM